MKPRATPNVCAVVGGNKRRFREQGFDLDLVYITDTVIGMSVPAVGGMSLYRNPIDEVARFFRTVRTAFGRLTPAPHACSRRSARVPRVPQYHENNFMLFNCTSECVYPLEPFGGNVRRYAVDDHNVPPLETIVAFCKELEQARARPLSHARFATTMVPLISRRSRGPPFSADGRPHLCVCVCVSVQLALTRPGIVYAIHCRGGKGRTGTMVCSWLLWTQHCQTAEEALELFQRRRTDERIKGKWQGVETASQKRYVRYVERYLASPERLGLTRPRPLVKIVVKNIFPDKCVAAPLCRSRPCPCATAP